MGKVANQYDRNNSTQVNQINIAVSRRSLACESQTTRQMPAASAFPSVGQTADQLALGIVLPLFILSYIAHSLWSYRRSRLAKTHTRRLSEESSFSAERKDLAEVYAEGKGRNIKAEPAVLEAGFVDLDFPNLTTAERAQIKADKVLYHKLQNLEENPGTHQALTEKRRRSR
jgi:hypothetical protein